MKTMTATLINVIRTNVRFAALVVDTDNVCRPLTTTEQVYNEYHNSPAQPITVNVSYEGINLLSIERA
jgi:hypothetical protein